MLNKSEIYINEKVNKKAVANFFGRNSHTEIHTVKIIKDGETLVKIVPKPYSCSDDMQVYSLSKSFTATAVGMLVDDGVITVEDYICDIFSDKIQKNHCENLDKLKIKHLLSMNSGHDRSYLEDSIGSEDMLKEMLSKNIEFEPSTHFTYNNGATYILSEIVSKYTGMTVFDFLYLRLFTPLDMSIKKWDAYKNGKSQGAIGLYINVDDIAKMGLLFLNKGKWNGKQIISEKWVEEASKFHSDNSENGTRDWSCGYGYQFWLNSFGGYRGDGALGQVMLILPKTNMVVAVQAFINDMQAEMDWIAEFANNILGDFSDCDIDCEKIIEEYYPVKKCDKTIFEKYSGIYLCENNDFDITVAKISVVNDDIVFSFSDGTKIQNMFFGIDKWSESIVRMKNFRPTLWSLVEKNVENEIRFASHCYSEDGILKVYIKFLDCPYNLGLELRIEENNINIYSEETKILTMKKQ